MSDEPIVPQFIDSNILIYAYDLTAVRKREIANILIKKCWNNQSGRISVQVLQEFFVNVTQKIANPLDRKSARQIVADLAFWKTHTPGPGDVLAAIDLQMEYQLSFWDAMILQSALQTGCTRIYSEDLSHEQVYHKIQVINPFAE